MGLRIDHLHEQYRIPQLVLVRRATQDLSRFEVRGFFDLCIDREAEMIEAILDENNAPIPHSQLVGKHVSGQDVGVLTCQYRCKTRLIEQHVQQPAAD